MTDTSTIGHDGGGGVYSNGGSVGTVFSSVSQDSVTVTADGNNNGGGAIFNDSVADFYFTSSISDNSFALSGAGALNSGGGAIHGSGGSISNVTVAGNSINAPGGGLFLDGTGGIFDLKNTIVADNTAGSVQNRAGSGTFRSEGFNLESKNACGFTATGDLANSEPMLGPLQDNGGPTPTQALLAGSPAIDAGSCTDIVGNPLIIDQRGTARPQPANGSCDIGAFELAGGGSGGSGSGGSGSPPPPPPPAPPAPPATVPGTPAATSSTGASFSGSVNPHGQTTTAFFQYGIDARFRPGGGATVVYDQSTPPQTLTAAASPLPVSATAANLVPNALYHVRLVAQNATGTTFGADQTFTTPAAAAPPPPVLGQSVNVKPVSGQVFVLVAGKLVPLTDAQQIRSGAVLDTRRGSLQLTAAAQGHKRETGVFAGAIFKLTQARNGLTNLSLAEGAFSGAPTYATCRAHKAGEAAAAALSSKTLQLLHASAHGKFRTSGRYAAATVRGTKWTTADRCDGTIVHDVTDSVAVSDFARHKTIILHGGQSYLARAPRRG